MVLKCNAESYEHRAHPAFPCKSQEQSEQHERKHAPQLRYIVRGRQGSLGTSMCSSEWLRYGALGDVSKVDHPSAICRLCPGEH